MLNRTRLLVGIAVASTAACAAASLPGARAPGAAQPPFRLMVITGIDVPVNNNPEMVDGAKAAVQAINKTGGLKGRQIQFTFCNFQGTAAGAVACARQAAEGNFDNVIEAHVNEPQTRPILDQAGIPRIGQQPINAVDFFDRNAFPVAPESSMYFAAPIFHFTQKLNKKRFAVVGLDVAAALRVNDVQRTAIRKAGAQYLGVVAIPFTTTDFLPAAQRLKSLDPDVVMVVSTASIFIGLWKAAAQIGFEPTWSHTPATIKEGNFKDLPGNGEGLYGGAPWPPATASLPGMKTYRAQLTAAGLNKSANLTTVGINGWLDVWTLRKLCDTLKTGECTKTTLVAAARKAKSIDMFGIVKWSPGQRGPSAYPNTPVGVGYVQKVVGGKWTLADPKVYDVYSLIGIARK
jgi:ABC-type branched-subunit amino acid transport system substrate-binding protein